MRNFLKIIFFVATGFVSGSSNALALSVLDTGGSAYNPLYIQVQQDPLQQKIQQYSQKKYQNEQKENSLKSSYGLSNYYSCSSGMSEQDLSDPDKAAQYLSTVQYCLEHKTLREKQSQQSTTDASVCPSGYVIKNGSCVTSDAGCKATYGQYSSFQKNDGQTGAPVCGCSAGYKWNEGQTSCVLKLVVQQSCPYLKKGTVFFPAAPSLDNPSSLAPSSCVCGTGYEVDKSGQACIEKDKEIGISSVKTNEQVCIDAYGVSSIFTGIDRANGKITCDCKIGYRWNQGQTQCVAIPKKETVAAAPVSKNGLEINKTKEDSPVFTKEDSEFLNEELKSLTGGTPKNYYVEGKAKPRGLWSRMKGWFGF